MASHIKPFQRIADTVVLAVTATSATVTVPGGFGTGSLRVFNAGPNTAFITYGKSTEAGTAVLPVVGTPGNGVPIGSGAVEYLSLKHDFTTVSAIAAATQTATLYLTPGEGA